MIIQTLEQLNEFYEKAKQEDTLIYDIETSGLVYYDRAVERFGVSDWEILPNGDWIIGHAFLLPSTQESFYIPVRHLTGPWVSHYDILSINRIIGKLFANSDLTLVTHNGKFDIKFAKKEGIPFKGQLLDTLLMAHAANENEASFGLKELGVKYVEHDANAEKLALQAAQDEWIERTIAPIQAEIETLERNMTLLEREWKNSKKEQFKADLARKRQERRDVEKLLKTMPENLDLLISKQNLTDEIETLRGRVEEVNLRNPNQHLSQLPPAFLEQKRHREDLMDKITRIKKIKPIENLRNLPLDLVAKYAEQDVILTYALYVKFQKQLEAQGLWPLVAHPRTGICRYGEAIGKMEENGLLMDRAYIVAQIKNCEEKQAELEQKCYEAAGQIFNLRSAQQVCALTGLESSAREFLEVSEHPTAQLINEYRQWGRAKDTYFKVFLEYLDKEDRLHPDLLLLTVSGRASMKKPSMNTLPRESDIYNVRGAIIADPGWVLIDVDYCLHPDTLVQTVQGDKKISELKKGDVVYSYRNSEVFCNFVSASSPIKPLPAYKITLDNGKEIIASSDHKWIVRSTSDTSDIRKTEDLKVNNRLMPFRRLRQKSGYINLYAEKAFGQYTIEHREIMRCLNGGLPDNCHIHHKDGNKSNNLPENLEILDELEHLSHHAKINYQRQDHTLRIANQKISVQHRRSYKGEGNPNFGKGTSYVTNCLKCDKEIQSAPSQARKYCSKDCFQAAQKHGLNHRITKIEYIGIQPMWAITVENDHNFALEAGVFTCNSQLELRLLAHHSADPNLLRAYNNGIDVHQQTADMIGVPRQVAKRVNFSVVYGAGPEGLVHSLRMERVYLYRLVEDLGFEVVNDAYVTGQKLFSKAMGLKWDFATNEQKQQYMELGAAKNILEDYKLRFPLVDAYAKRAIEFAKRNRYTEMWTGRRRRYPDQKSATGGTYNLSRTAPNNQIQGGGSELLRLAITKLDRRFDTVEEETRPRMLLQVHDSLLTKVRVEGRDYWTEIIVNTMQSVAKFKVPIVADAKTGFRWNELEKWEKPL